MGSVVAVLAFLSLSTAGAVQARQIALRPVASSSFLQDFSLWVTSRLADVWAKDGITIDPNGTKHVGVQRVSGGPERSPGRLAGESK
jgi:hypothetical protein